MLFPTRQNMRISYQIKNQLLNMKKIQLNSAELENKVTEINYLTAELTKVIQIAVPTNLSNLNSESNNTSITINS